MNVDLEKQIVEHIKIMMEELCKEFNVLHNRLNELESALKDEYDDEWRDINWLEPHPGQVDYGLYNDKSEFLKWRGIDG